MIEFNDFLQKTGMDLRRVRLVRHQDNRARSGTSPYDLWIAADGRYELYQRIQRKERFKSADWIVSLVATPLNETIFTGIFKVEGIGVVPPGTADPVGGHDVSGLHFYDLRPTEFLREYAGRIVLDWGSGYRSWVQRPDRRNKAVIEVRRCAVDPPFPGFSSFSWPMQQLATVPSSWRQVLSAVSGVYLQVCQTTGKQYVGSAYGLGGFWQRWEAYVSNGHGGNAGMKAHPHRDYLVSVLELAASSSTQSEIIQMEERWKERLLTRKFGLNL